MAGLDDETQQNRKELVYTTILREPGMTEQELTTRLNIGTARTVNNYLRALESEGRIYKDRKYWYPSEHIDRHLRWLDVTPEQGMALYLAARSLARVQDERNEIVESALLQLAEAIKGDVVLGDAIHQAAVELSLRPERTGYNKVFRELMQSYVYRRAVKINYAPARGNPFNTVFKPYLFEPSLFGLSVYAIGHSSIVDSIRTYKLERIRSIESLTGKEASYVVPSDFPGLELVRTGWSGMFGERRTRVRLRFSPLVRKRVMETYWHGSQRTDDDPADPRYLIWEAHVADWTDMLPWVKGWGADVFVVEPPEMRLALVIEASRLSMLYEVVNSPKISDHLLLWAKTDRNNDSNPAYHPLICHLIDAGQVARQIWKYVFTLPTRQRICDGFGLADDEVEKFLAFVAAVHDIGKASPSFQQQNLLGKQRVIDRFPIGEGIPNCRHEAISMVVLANYQEQALFYKGLTGWDKTMSLRIAQAISGHHGLWQASAEPMTDQIGHGAWDAVREDIYNELVRIFEPPHIAWINPADESALLVLLSGIISVSDWIASREASFPFASKPNGDVEFNPDDYVARSEQLASAALSNLNWMDWQPPDTPMLFETQFDVATPRPMQEKIIELASEQLASRVEARHPTLVIIEDTTGSGKTEAALYLADHWSIVNLHHGTYIAMPTMATSNQMFDRYDVVLKRRYAHRPNLQLAHSQAEWHLGDSMAMNSMGEPNDQDQQAAAQAENWFAPRRRTLLATFGVGTVDQALMSVLQTKHFFVRLMALANKTVIFDEVHAYDAHMSVLFRATLTWLRALGSSIVILSATLPLDTRRKLLMAYGIGHDESLRNRAYPSLVWAQANTAPKVIKIDSEAAKVEPRILPFRFIGRDMAAIAAELRRLLKDGGCAVVIVNRVKRAQDLYSELQETFKTEFADGWIKPKDFVLFHARFPQIERKAIENEVLAKFGKPVDTAGHDSTERPLRGILIATQVVEQSLDLDFDVMITDPAPIDLLIQRAGRLWRHNRAMRRVTEQVLLITKPEAPADVPRFGKDEYVYAPYMLLRSWLHLQRSAQQKTLVLPDQTRDLIEAVYGSEDEMPDASEFSVEEQNTLTTLWEKLRTHEATIAYKAGFQQIPLPSVTGEAMMHMQMEARDEDDPALGEFWRARTRNIQASVSLICLQVHDNKVYLDQACTEEISSQLLKDPDKTTIQRLMGRVISVTNPRVVRFFAELDLPPDKTQLKGWIAPPSWKKKGVLRYHYMVLFNSEGEFRLWGTEYSLRLTTKLGLQVLTQEELKKMKEKQQ